MPNTVAFDANGTILNLAALDPHFEAAFGSRDVRKEWFEEMLKQAFVSTITGAYEDFSKIGKSALMLLEERHQRRLSHAQQTEILDTMQKLPAFADVPQGLERLKAAGWRLVVLTNSTLKVAQAALTHAGLRPSLEHIFSADGANRLKPAPEPYEMVARKLGVPANEIILAAAHAWDIAGAHNAGCKTAFIKRPGMLLDSLTPKPDYEANDLLDLAAQLGKPA